MSEEKDTTTPATDAAEVPALTVEPGMKYLVDPAAFEHGLRVAKMFSACKLVPDNYKNSPQDCFLALHRAMSLGIDPLFYMEHSYVVHGKLAVDGQMCKTMIDTSGLYTTELEWEMTGKGDDLCCIAYATHVSGKIHKSEPLSIKQVKAWGWWDKKESKWPLMPEQMLRYRTAAFFVKAFQPRLLGGAQTVEEMIDINGVTVIRPAGRRSALNDVLASKEKA